MEPRTLFVAVFVFSLFTLPMVSAITVNITNGGVSDIGQSDIPTGFGMIVGKISFKVGNYSWVPEEIWLLPENVSPSVFSKGLTQNSVIEVPKNVTWSTCRTAVYYNNASGYGFKIYNTGTTTQISSDGTFCGLAYNGTYFVVSKQ